MQKKKNQMCTDLSVILLMLTSCKIAIMVEPIFWTESRSSLVGCNVKLSGVRTYTTPKPGYLPAKKPVYKQEHHFPHTFQERDLQDCRLCADQIWPKLNHNSTMLHKNSGYLTSVFFFKKNNGFIHLVASCRICKRKLGGTFAQTLNVLDAANWAQACAALLVVHW
jgi:hypothetical protein